MKSYMDESARFSLAILAALMAIGGLLIHQNHVNEAAAAAAAAKSAAILQQQQKEADAIKKDDEDMRRRVEESKHKSRAWNRGGSSTNGYIP